MGSKSAIGELVENGFISESNFADCSLTVWQEHFNLIYGKKNESLSSEELWARVYENASKVAENLRRYRYAAAFQSLAHVTCWVLGFANRTRKKLEDVVWRKYPYVCPYCRTLENDEAVRACSCGTKRTQLEEAETHVKATMIQDHVIKHFAEVFKEKKPSKIDGWVQMYARLYGNTTYSMPVEHIGFHLMEEIGEVIRVLRRRKEFDRRVEKGLEKGTDVSMAKQAFEYDLDSELADVFSWTCTLAYKIESLAQALKDFQDQLNDLKEGRAHIRIQFPYAKPTDIPFNIPQVTFSSVLYWEYGNGCPNCNSIPCTENCFLSECEYRLRGGKCGFVWSGRDRCKYGKLKSQSDQCSQC